LNNGRLEVFMAVKFKSRSSGLWRCAVLW